MEFVCDICDKTFIRRQHFKLHFARNHTDKSKWEHQCTTCKKTFAAREILERHKLNHNKTFQLNCGFQGCSKVFHSSSALNKHRRTVHIISNKPTKQYECEVIGCSASFNKHHILKQHSFIHTGIPPFKCEKCDKRFKTATHKTRHEKVHDGYPCFKCSIILKTWSKLREHMVTDHTKIHKCLQCDKIFPMECRLKEHMLVHKSIRKVFKCKDCNVTFVKKGNFKVHVKTVHLGEKSYNCCQCNKNFAYQCSLQKHKETHNNNTKTQPSTSKKLRKQRKDKLSLISRITGFDPNKSIISLATLS